MHAEKLAGSPLPGRPATEKRRKYSARRSEYHLPNLAAQIAALNIDLARTLPGLHRALCPGCRDPRHPALIALGADLSLRWRCDHCGTHGGFRPAKEVRHVR